MTKKILTYAVLGGLFLVPLLPFVVSTTMFFPFITAKGFAFRILIEILLGLYVFLAVIAPEFRPKWSWITKAVLVFLAVMLVADLLGENPYKSIWSNFERMEGFVLLAHLAAYYIVASSVLTAQSWRRFWNVSIAASVVMSFYGVLQLLGKLTINQGGVRLDATFGNAAYLAIYLVFHIFLSLYMLVRADRTWQKWTYGLVAVFETYILYFTATRGAILGLIGGLLLVALIIAVKEGGKVRKYAYGMLFGILIVIGGFVAVRNTSFVQKSPVLSRFSALGFAEFQTQGRYFVWPMALKGVAERPLLGWGQENFNFVFNKYYDPRMYAQEQWFDRTHDIFLDWLIAGGIIGFLAYASMYVALLYYIWRRKSDMTVMEKSVLTGMIAAYVFHNIFVFDNLISYIMFFSVLGYVHSRSTASEVTGASSFGSMPAPARMFSPEIANYLIAPVVLIATVAGVYYVNVPAVQTSAVLIRAITPQTTGGPEKNLELFKQVFSYHTFGTAEAVEQLVQTSAQVAASQDVPDSLKQEFYDYAKTKLEEKIQQTPTDARYLVFAGTFFNRFAQYDLAIDYLNRAIKESPKKQSIYFELGSSYLGKGDTAKALELFKTAYDFEPAAPESKIIYAIGAIYAHNGELAKQLLSEIGVDTVISDNRFLQTYARIGDFQSVIAILTARLQKDPKNMQYQISLASAYLQIGQKQKAISIIQGMIQQDPTFKDQGEQYIKQIQNS